jgi:hypothetical protein
MTAIPKRAANAIYARVTADGSFVPADQLSRNILRRKKIRRGDIVRLVASKPRDYGQWKKAHELGTFIANNIDEFERFATDDGKIDSHGALKHLQALSGIECDESRVILEDNSVALIRTPRTLAFDEMEEGEFQAAYAGFCQYIINRWWPSMTAAQIEHAASLVGMAA